MACSSSLPTPPTAYPPPFRASIWSKLSPSDKTRFLYTFHMVANWVIQASIPVTQPLHSTLTPPHPSETTATPFWTLLLLLEPLLLSPITHTPYKTNHQAFQARLHLFKLGHIQDLFDTAWTPPPNLHQVPPTPLPTQPSVTQFPLPRQP